MAKHVTESNLDQGTVLTDDTSHLSDRRHWRQSPESTPADHGIPSRAKRPAGKTKNEANRDEKVLPRGRLATD